jgi:hypothetical protein
MTTTTHIRFVTAIGPDVLVSPNSSALIKPPYNMSRIDMADDPSPYEGATLRWSLNSMPQLGYCLQSPRYQGPLLQRLAYTPSTLPIVYDYGWRLSRNVADSWWSLEECLLAITVELFTSASVFHSLDFAYFRKPSQYGYRRAFTKRHRARNCCMNAHDAFVPLMALCSYAISLTPSFTDENPKWVSKLEEKNIHPEWIQMLKTSQLADFSVDNKRVGVIVQHNCTWRNRIPNMIRANVPLWFLWNDPTHFSDLPWLYKQCCPTREEVNEARLSAQWREEAKNVASTQYDSTVHDDSTAASLPINEQFPKPDPFSGQKRGETMDEFFARQAARHVLMESNESAAERRSRLDRERAARDHHCPGRGASTRCFTWEEIDGFMMRTYLVRSAVEDCWDSYTNSQRRFDSFYNEWDLAIEFDPDASVDDDQYEHDVDDMFIRSDTPPPPPPYPPSPSPPTAIFTNDITATYRNNISDGSPYHNEVGDMTIQNAGQDPLDYVLFWRFGYNWDGVSSFTFSKPTPMLPPWKHTQKTLTDIESEVDIKEQFAITNFVDYLVCNRTVPSALWDLNSDNPYPLYQNINPKLVVNPKSFDNTTYYLIQPAYPPSSNHSSWNLIVHDPATALECCRRDLGPSVIDVAKVFLLAGKPFSTRIHSDGRHRAPVRPLRRSDPVRLGWRRMGYRGDSHDYAGYENRRTAFLAQPHGRAAALKGGIVWRLTINSIELNHACIGPSDDVFEYGDVITSDLNGEELWDDALSEDELDLICGVYKVQTQHNQTSDSSWWPKHSVWMASGLNVGYWSVGCETWFQMRLDSIRNGTAGLRTAAEWRDSLRFWRPTGPFIANHRRAAAAYLSGESVS